MAFDLNKSTEDPWPLIFDGSTEDPSIWGSMAPPPGFLDALRAIPRAPQKMSHCHLKKSSTECLFVTTIACAGNEFGFKDFAERKLLIPQLSSSDPLPWPTFLRDRQTERQNWWRLYLFAGQSFHSHMLLHLLSLRHLLLLHHLLLHLLHHHRRRRHHGASVAGAVLVMVMVGIDPPLVASGALRTYSMISARPLIHLMRRSYYLLHRNPTTSKEARIKILISS